jgi:lysophospholipase L1-like esterase
MRTLMIKSGKFGRIIRYRSRTGIRAPIGVLALAVWAAAGCGVETESDEWIYIPNQTRACFCPDGTQAVATCGNGTSFSVCPCDGSFDDSGAGGADPGAGNAAPAGEGGAGGEPIVPIEEPDAGEDRPMDLDQNVGGAGGAGGASPGAGGAAGSDAPGSCPIGETTGNQVILIGDSYLASGASFGGPGGIQAQVEARATDAGALNPGERYRTYYVGGTRFLDGSIQDQYAKARAENPDIEVVIMDGGGNDILLGLEGCNVGMNPADPVCVEVMERSTAALSELVEEMRADGVTDIVYFFYPEVPAAPGHSRQGEPMARAACEAFTSPTRCHFVSTIAAFEGRPDYFSFDGVHPSPAGQTAIGDLVWEAMEANCIAQ